MVAALVIQDSPTARLVTTNGASPAVAAAHAAGSTVLIRRIL